MSYESRVASYERPAQLATHNSRLTTHHEIPQH